MNLPSHNIRITHEKFGVLLDETFVNPSQFKLFLKMVQGCIEMKTDLTFFDGVGFMFHIPNKHLIECIIITKMEPYTLTDHLMTKSKIETPTS